MSTHELLASSKRAAQQLLDLLFPPTCTICKKNGVALCPACLATIPLLQPPFCWHCSSTHLSFGQCVECQKHPLQMSGLRAVSGYQGTVRTCIQALKYDGSTQLAQPLGTVLAHVAITYGMQADLLLPVPLHSERQRQRGYNHAQLLSEVCSQHLHIPTYTNILIRTRATTAQVQLAAWERQQNVVGAFACTSDFATGALRGRRIIIIDDVCTTGATLEACAAVLFAAGAAEVWGLVLARSL